MTPSVSKVRVLIPIQQGHIARLLIYSGVVQHLVNMDAHVIILTKQGDKSDLRNDLPTKNITFDTLPVYRHSLNTIWYRIYVYLFQTILPTSSSRAREEWIRQVEPRRFHLIHLVKRLGAKKLLQAWIMVRRVMLPAGLVENLWLRHQPD